MIRYIVECVEKDKFTVYSDKPGFRTANGGSIPATMCVTLQKPDVVILDDIKKEVHMFKLTVNWETLCDKNNKYKNDRYAHFLTDITTHTPSRTAFEVGGRGQISKDKMQRLQQIHKFTKQAKKLITFNNNLSAFAVNYSYFISTCRKQPVWSQTDYLGPPF